MNQTTTQPSAADSETLADSMEAPPLSPTTELASLRAQLKQRNDALSLLKSHIQCGVCLDVLRAPYALTCGHAFCRRCLASFFHRSDPEEYSDSGSQRGSDSDSDLDSDASISDGTEVESDAPSEKEDSDNDSDGAYAAPSSDVVIVEPATRRGAAQKVDEDAVRAARLRRFGAAAAPATTAVQGSSRDLEQGRTSRFFAPKEDDTDDALAKTLLELDSDDEKPPKTALSPRATTSHPASSSDAEIAARLSLASAAVPPPGPAAAPAPPPAVARAPQPAPRGSHRLRNLICPTCRAPAPDNPPIKIVVLSELVETLATVPDAGGTFEPRTSPAPEDLDPPGLDEKDKTWGGLWPLAALPAGAKATKERQRDRPNLPFMRDTEDRVRRCLVCNWEIEVDLRHHQGHCVNCDDEDYYVSSDSDIDGHRPAAGDSDDAESVGTESYDSDDGFIAPSSQAGPQFLSDSGSDSAEETTTDDDSDRYHAPRRLPRVPETAFERLLRQARESAVGGVVVDSDDDDNDSSASSKSAEEEDEDGFIIRKRPRRTVQDSSDEEEEESSSGGEEAPAGADDDDSEDADDESPPPSYSSAARSRKRARIASTSSPPIRRR